MTMWREHKEEAYRMKQFNIAEAKSHFSEMVKSALLGEDVVIARGNKPLLKLVPIVSTPPG